MSINLHEDHYDFQIILGKVEREKFESIKHEFPIVKKLILIKKKPNRKPISKEDAVYGNNSDWSMCCTGCDTLGCHCCGEGNELCEPLKCLNQNNMDICFDCEKYPCEKATVGYRQLEHKSISSDDVTWAVLPYVPHQYEEQ